MPESRYFPWDEQRDKTDIYLEGSTELYCVSIIHHSDSEVRRLQELFEQEAVLQHLAACGSKKMSVEFAPDAL